jgi:hypothetical protein
LAELRRLGQVAARRGTDVTALLRAHDIPLTFFDPDYYKALMAVSKSERQEFTSRQLLIYDDEYEAAYPQWVTSTRFFWAQTFPPGESVIVEHRYKPVVGHSYLTASGLHGEDGDAYRKRFCLDAAAESALGERFKAESTPDQPALLTTAEVQYILTTASNWRGPIGHFHLTIEAGEPDTIVSLCASGLKQTAPGRLEFDKADYVPTQDLDILFVQHMVPEP